MHNVFYSYVCMYVYVCTGGGVGLDSCPRQIRIEISQSTRMHLNAEYLSIHMRRSSVHALKYDWAQINSMKQCNIDTLYLES